MPIIVTKPGQLCNVCDKIRLAGSLLVWAVWSISAHFLLVFQPPGGQNGYCLLSSGCWQQVLPWRKVDTRRYCLSSHTCIFIGNNLLFPIEIDQLDALTQFLITNRRQHQLFLISYWTVSATRLLLAANRRQSYSFRTQSSVTIIVSVSNSFRSKKKQIST